MPHGRPRGAESRRHFSRRPRDISAPLPPALVTLRVTPRFSSRLERIPSTAMPRVLEPVTVVKTPEVDITEYAGNGSSGQPAVSIAKVVAQGVGRSRGRPEFDEWVLVNEGKVHIEHSHGPTVEVTAGQAVYLAKGERVRWVFPEGGCTYDALCLPASRPPTCTARTRASPRPTTSTWTSTTWYRRTCGRRRRRRRRRRTIPPYASDSSRARHRRPGSTCSPVGNHFYKDTKDPADASKPSHWTLLQMTRHA